MAAVDPRTTVSGPTAAVVGPRTDAYWETVAPPILLVSVLVAVPTMYLSCTWLRVTSDRSGLQSKSTKRLIGHGFFKPESGFERATQKLNMTYTGCLRLELKRDEVYLKDNASYFVPRPHIVNNFLPKLIIQAKNLCPERKLFLLIVVPSVAQHVSMRQAIRNTWASPMYGSPWPRMQFNHSMKIIFFLGVDLNVTASESRQLTEETLVYGDVVQADFLDSYRNLSLKMAAVLHWSATYCRSARHLLKVDEDTFVNLPLLLELLEVVSSYSSYFVLGHAATIATVIKPVMRTGKWGVSYDVYPFPSYPVYLFGHSYVVSGDIISNLLFAYQHMPLVQIEDALFTGILRKAVGIKLIRCWQFASLSDETHISRCSLLKNLSISQTGFNKPAGLYAVWEWYVAGHQCLQ